MEIEIFKLVYEYSIKNKFVDKEFICKLLDIVVRNRKLKEYINKIDFRSNLSDDKKYITPAEYKPYTKELLIDLETIKNLIELNKRYEVLFTPFGVAMFRNLVCVQYILHEVEHAYQMKLADNIQNVSIEAVLSRVCSMMHQTLKNPKVIELLFNGQMSKDDIYKMIAKCKKEYVKYYRFNPIERLAQIKSLNTIRNTIESIKSDVPELYAFFEASVYEEILKSYRESIEQDACPTSIYLNATDHGDVWRNFEFYSPDKEELMKNVCEQYDLFQRLTYGLPVTQDKYNTSVRYVKSMNKFRIKKK